MVKVIFAGVALFFSQISREKYIETDKLAEEIHRKVVIEWDIQIMSTWTIVLLWKKQI